MDKRGVTNPYNPDSNVTMPVGDMSIWDDDLSVDNSHAAKLIRDQSAEIVGLRDRLSHVITNAVIAQVLAFALGVMLGYWISYVW